MLKMKLFIDTHDKRNGTFPDKIGKDDFAGVYRNYEKACLEENVVIVQTMTSAEEGRMFCVNLAPDADAIRRAHAKIGLAFDTITEVNTTSPGDIYFQWK